MYLPKIPRNTRYLVLFLYTTHSYMYLSVKSILKYLKIVPDRKVGAEDKAGHHVLLDLLKHPGHHQTEGELLGELLGF